MAGRKNQMNQRAVFEIGHEKPWRFLPFFSGKKTTFAA
jgi:hypothetical protein